MFGELTISGLFITTSTIGFLSNHFVTSELFCGEDMYFSDGYTYERTFIEFDTPKGFDKCLIRLRDGINIFTKIIIVP